MQWQIGKAKIRAVIEQQLDGVATLISKAEPGAVREIAWLRPHFATEDGQLLGVIQCFVVEIGSRILVVDTCVGDGKDIPVS